MSLVVAGCGGGGGVAEGQVASDAVSVDITHETPTCNVNAASGTMNAVGTSNSGSSTVFSSQESLAPGSSTVSRAVTTTLLSATPGQRYQISSAGPNSVVLTEIQSGTTSTWQASGGTVTVQKINGGLGIGLSFSNVLMVPAGGKSQGSFNLSYTFVMG